MSNSDSDKIPSNKSDGVFAGGSLGFLRAVALIILFIGAAGSLVFMLRAGQRTPRLLLILFIFWVLAPFAVLFWANVAPKRWSVMTRMTLDCVMIIVALGSLAIYGEWIDIRPAGSANAFLWVIVPPASLVFITVIVGIVALLSSRLSRRGGDN